MKRKRNILLPGIVSAQQSKSRQLLLLWLLWCCCCSCCCYCYSSSSFSPLAPYFPLSSSSSSLPSVPALGITEPSSISSSSSSSFVNGVCTRGGGCASPPRQRRRNVLPWTRLYAQPPQQQPQPADSGTKAQQQQQHQPPLGLRLNKVFKSTHSRRQSDVLIATGRVSVNGHVVQDAGRRVGRGDVVCLDGTVVTGWQAEWQASVDTVIAIKAIPESSLSSSSSSSSSSEDDDHNTDQDDTHHGMKHEYIKYWKPVGIICTTDRRIPKNILDELLRNDRLTTPPRVVKRIFPVGRLDKETSGLILLTSDGRLPNAVLRGAAKQAKTYHVTTDRYVSNHHVQQLQNGVVITTQSGQYGATSRKTLTARTRPAQVERLVVSSLEDDDDGSRDGVNQQRPRRHVLQMTLVEGRNRQIRKMLAAVGYEVTALQRVAFIGLTLDGLPGPGHWQRLNENELALLERALQAAYAEPTTTATTSIQETV